MHKPASPPPPEPMEFEECVELFVEEFGEAMREECEEDCRELLGGGGDG